MQNRNKPYQRGDVVLIDMPLMRNSHVLGGVRPWVIVQNDLGNQFSPTSIVCPLTTQFKKIDMPTHIAIAWDKLLPSVVQCEQVRVVDVRDDWKYIVTLPPEIMEHIDAALRNAFFYKKDVGGYRDDVCEENLESMSFGFTPEDYSKFIQIGYLKPSNKE